MVHSKINKNTIEEKTDCVLMHWKNDIFFFYYLKWLLKNLYFNIPDLRRISANSWDDQSSGI